MEAKNVYTLSCRTRQHVYLKTVTKFQNVKLARHYSQKGNQNQEEKQIEKKEKERKIRKENIRAFKRRIA
jgi:hypothetical protein